MITSDAQEFAAALDSIDNRNEVIILLKDPGVAPMAADFLDEMAPEGAVVAAVRAVPPTAERRRTPGLARAGAAAQSALLTVLAAQGIEPYRYDDHALAVRIPNEKIVPVLNVLLHHPNVDYVEANQARPVSLAAGPVGSNSADTKHTFHEVLGAWDYTRGTGAAVGILDSGFAYDSDTDQWHPDGQMLNDSTGIDKNGFVDDYRNYEPCDQNGSQPYGGCVPWDDNFHGTAMAGLVGANDNSFGAVGVMPEGLTVSMKIAVNCYIADQCSVPATFQIEDDDFYWGVRWASNNDIRVLSMSFSGTGFGSAVSSALYDAYHTYDVLPLAATGNPSTPDNYDYPKAWSFVMGVGGLNSDGTNYGKDDYEEISALAGGKTTIASCPSPYSFCTPASYYSSPGGTSSSTAIAAGIAGLVRSYEPFLTAAQVRQRLIDTSTGVHNKIDARAAVLNRIPLSATMTGPSVVQASEVRMWTADVSGGSTPYSYTWYRDGVQVSTASSYIGNTGTSDFDLQVDVVDSASDSTSAFKMVTVNQCPNGQVMC